MSLSRLVSILAILYICLIAATNAQLADLKITLVNGAAPTTSLENLQYIIPPQAKVTVAWTFTAPNANSEYRATLQYTNPTSSTYPLIIPNISPSLQTYEFAIPLGGASTEGLIQLTVFDSASQLSQVATPAFTTQSYCETIPDYCGAGNTCAPATNACTCVDASLSGPRCSTTRCTSLGCNAANTDSCVSDEDDELQCICKDGFEGPFCQFATICQTKECDNDGFVAYTLSETGVILCDTQCSCPDQYQNKNPLAANAAGCTECDISCSNDGVMRRNRCSCKCQNGYMGIECKGHYALGKLTFLAIGEKFTPTNALYQSRFVATLTPLVQNIMKIDAAEIKAFGQFVDGDEFNVVFQFPYTSTDTKPYLAPRGALIHSGWKLLQDDMAQSSGSAIGTFYADALANTPAPPAPPTPSAAALATSSTPAKRTKAERMAIKVAPLTDQPLPSRVQALNKAKSSQKTHAMTAQQAATGYLQPEDLWDPSCSEFQDCTTGAWPMNYPDMYDQTNKDAVKWWVLGLAIGCIVVALLLIFTFFLVGNDRNLTAASMEQTSKLRAADREERLKLLIDYEETRETMRLEAKTLRDQQKRRDQPSLPVQENTLTQSTPATTSTTPETTSTAAPTATTTSQPEQQPEDKDEAATQQEENKEEPVNDKEDAADDSKGEQDAQVAADAKPSNDDAKAQEAEEPIKDDLEPVQTAPQESKSDNEAE